MVTRGVARALGASRGVARARSRAEVCDRRRARGTSRRDMRALRAASARATTRDGAKRASRARRSKRVARNASSATHEPWELGLGELHFSTRDVDALAGASARDDALGALSPTWRTLLLSDGSVTRHLSVLGRAERTEVEVTRRSARDDGTRARGRPSRPSDVEAMLRGPIVRREVYLRAGEVRGADGRPAVYAASWWNEDALAAYLPDEDASMWANLRTRHVELHREIREVYYGESEGLEAAFGERGPFWGRHYIFWSGGAPITVVYEVFNPAAFERALGPLKAA